MTFLSLAQGCRRLGVDPKTLRRWLAQAHIPLQSHPSDGRLKGISEEHLLLVAHSHHRCLSPRLDATPPTPACGVPSLLPLALPETLTVVQATTLQQQMTALTSLLQQATTVPPAPCPTPPARRSPPTPSVVPKPPRAPAHVLPLVESDSTGGYVVISPVQGRLCLEPDSPAWFAWLATLASFRFVSQSGRLTVHREVERLSGAAWRAHRKIRNHTYNLHLGSTNNLTMAALEHAAATLQAHLK